MRGKLWFIGGLATGFVLGARAGREKYEELVLRGRKVLDHPTVQEAAGVAQAQASRLYSEGKDRLSHSRLGEKLSTGGTDNGRKPELGASSDTTMATSSARTGSSTPSPSTSNPTSSSRPTSSGTGANGSSI
ncbi:MAG TPA: hypothetical protein VGD43_15410 [Micromonospora sp.]